MQFRTMRRSRQLLSQEESESVLKRGSHGVLACLGDGDYPYAVPLNYVYYEGKIFLHSAREGHKVDAILRHPKVSFTVVDEDTIVPAQYTSCFRSVIVFWKGSSCRRTTLAEGLPCHGGQVLCLGAGCPAHREDRSLPSGTRHSHRNRVLHRKRGH